MEWIVCYCQFCSKGTEAAYRSKNGSTVCLKCYDKENAQEAQPPERDVRATVKESITKNKKLLDLLGDTEAQPQKEGE